MKKKIRFRIEGEAAWLNEIKVQQVLPNEFIQAIGPFVLLEHIHSFKKISDNPTQSTRGIATLMYILSGEVEHADSMGNHTKLLSGDVHWMKAGKGVLHYEEISAGNNYACPDVSVIQFWINLPSSRKTEEPEYYFLSTTEIPKQTVENNAGWIKILSGKFENTESSIPNYSKEFIYHLHLEAKGKFSTVTSNSIEYACFLPAKCATINDIKFQSGDCIVFTSLGEMIEIVNESETPADLILFGGESYKEPIVTDGNFVMNNPHEISQAYNDYYDGKYGQLKQKNN